MQQHLASRLQAAGTHPTGDPFGTNNYMKLKAKCRKRIADC